MSSVIPNGEMKCIWADAGFVSFKLCDRRFDCDNCAFDQVMRQRSTTPSRDASGIKNPVIEEESRDDLPVPTEVGVVRTNHETLAGLMNDFLMCPVSVPLPDDRLYSRNHVWIKDMGNGRHRMGIDHCASTFLLDAGSIILPQADTFSTRNTPFVWIILDDGTLAIRSSIDGKILTSNAELKEAPYLMTKDPYETGWISEIAIEQTDWQKTCLRATEMQPYYAQQFQELKIELLTGFDRKPLLLGATMMDGGSKPRNLRDILGTQKYLSFLKRLLSMRV